MKIKSTIQFFVLLYSITAHSWGMDGTTRSNPFLEPLENPAVTENYREQRNALYAERNQETPKSTPQLPQKTSFLQRLLSKFNLGAPKKTATPASSDDLTSPSFDPENLSKAEREAIANLAKSPVFKSSNPFSGPKRQGDFTFQHQTSLLKELFKTELKKIFESNSDDVELLMKELNKTIVQQTNSLREIVSSNNKEESSIPLDTTPFLKNIRTEMNRILANPQKEIASLNMQAAILQANELATSLAAKAAEDERKNPTLIDVVSLKPPFTSKKTKADLKSLKNTIAGLQKTELTAPEKKAVNDPLTLLNAKLTELTGQGPRGGDWLGRKKWSNIQETDTSTALKNTTALLADFQTKRDLKTAFAREVDGITRVYRENDNLSTQEKLSVFTISEQIKSKANKLIENNEPVNTPQFLKELKNTLITIPTIKDLRDQEMALKKQKGTEGNRLKLKAAVNSLMDLSFSDKQANLSKTQQQRITAIERMVDDSLAQKNLTPESVVGTTAELAYQRYALKIQGIKSSLNRSRPTSENSISELETLQRQLLKDLTSRKFKRYKKLNLEGPTSFTIDSKFQLGWAHQKIKIQLEIIQEKVATALKDKKLTPKKLVDTSAQDAYTNYNNQVDVIKDLASRSIPADENEIAKLRSLQEELLKKLKTLERYNPLPTGRRTNI